jgi:hypothetical protein
MAGKPKYNDSDLIGKKFGRWTILSVTDKRSKERQRFINCICECGTNRDVRLSELIRQASQSCGCLNRENLNKAVSIHNESGTRFYEIWEQMRRRCLVPTDKAYKNYGARGITICHKWLRYEGFREDMMPLYKKACKELGERNTTIERIDVNGNYEPSNCTFIHRCKQPGNTRKNRTFMAIDQTNRVAIVHRNQEQFAKLINASPSTVNGCLHGRLKDAKRGQWTFTFLEEKTMSHISRISILIRGLDVLEKACVELGCKLIRGQKHYAWYGEWVGDTPMPEGVRIEDLGKCEHIIQVPRADYEIGVIRVDDHYELIYDYWHPGGIETVLGEGLSKLKQAYAVESTKRLAAKKGFRIAEKKTQDGVQLTLTPPFSLKVGGKKS